ncbi:MAG: hypothetical protein GIW94_14710 [Candidatus Eremiobacteraeota bacterium]|nr:hypothetical protein [Candidatus Eremiobacteraeota bacterium]MBC5820520.1 hypothetical protein [Candidatus Eremiobacteraeota bacterium]
MNARGVAFAVVRDVFGPDARTAQAAFDVRARRAELGVRDRAFAAELAYGSIKQRRLLDWLLAPYVGSRAKPLAPAVADILRLGVYQLRFMHGVEDHAAIFETVNLAWRHGHKGTAGLVNAVLRRMQAEGPREPQRPDFESDADYFGTLRSVPTWIAQQFIAALNGRSDAALAAVNRAPRSALRVNTLRCDVGEVRSVLDSRGMAAEPSPYVAETLLLDGTPAGDDADGRWNVQSEAAAMPVDLLSPQPGEAVLELCSGRGNKTLQMAARLHDRGTIVSIERDPKKMAVLSAALKRAGIAAVRPILGDALNVAAGSPADAVLLDAPCSGIGIIGRHPEARWRKRPGDGERLARSQRALLSAAAEQTKCGGRLVYSVCSIDPREGRAVVDAFLAADPAFVRAAIPQRYADFVQDGDLLVPPGIDGRDGFYIASLVHLPQSHAP